MSLAHGREMRPQCQRVSPSVFPVKTGIHSSGEGTARLRTANLLIGPGKNANQEIGGSRGRFALFSGAGRDS